MSKTGQPYLYAAGNPTTLSDPSGLCSVGGGNSNEAGYAESLSACSLGKSVAQSTTMSAHDRMVYTLYRIWNEELGREKRRDDYLRRFADSGGNTWYYNYAPESHQRMVNDQATNSFVTRAAKEVSGLDSLGNGLLLFPEERARLPEPGRPHRVGGFPTEIKGTFGWKASLLDDDSAARHLFGYVALSYEYGHGQATAGLRVAEGDSASSSNSQQDYDLGVIGIGFGSSLGDGSVTVPEMIAGLDAATGDPMQGEFAPQRVAPSFPGMGQRDYTCYAFGWC